MNGRTRKIVAVLGTVAVASLSVFALWSHGSGAASAEEQVLSSLANRVDSAGVQIRGGQIKSSDPFVIAFELAEEGDEPRGVAAYRIWRQAALAKMSGLPVEWIEVDAFDAGGEPLMRAGKLIETKEGSDKYAVPASDMVAVEQELQSRVPALMLSDMTDTSVKVTLDSDGYRVANVDLIGTASGLGTSVFTDFVNHLQTQVRNLNEEGAGLVALSIKAVDNKGALQLWDIYDFQLDQNAGWHNPEFMPGWLPRPVPASEVSRVGPTQ